MCIGLHVWFNQKKSAKHFAISEYEMGEDDYLEDFIIKLEDWYYILFTIHKLNTKKSSAKML